MKLVKNAKHSWQWFSVQAMAGSAVLQAVTVAHEMHKAMDNPLIESVLSLVPAAVAQPLGIGLLVAGVVGRLVKQKNDDSE